VNETASRVEVTRVGPQHLAALTEFYRRVWDPGATLASVEQSRSEAARTNPVTPGEPPPTWIVLQNGEAIAHLTTIPIRLSLGDRERPAYWMKGLWVLPEFQRSSAGFLVLRAAMADVAIPALALVHEPAAIRLFQALKFNDLGALPNRLRILNPAAVVMRLDLDALGPSALPPWVRQAARVARFTAPIVGPLADVANGLWALAATGPLGGTAIDLRSAPDRRALDELWSDVRTALPAAPVRDASELTARYSPAAGYDFVQVRSRGRLIGIGVVKHPRDHGDPRLGGLRIATLSDFLFHPHDARAGLAVLRGAERVARALGADALLCSASARSVGALLTRRGYLPFPANLHVLARFPREMEAPPARIDDWWFTRGDSGGDGSF
jgi:hypothetical protein